MELIIPIFYLLLYVLAIKKLEWSITIFIAHLPIVVLVHTDGTIPFNSIFSFILFYQLYFKDRWEKGTSVNPKVYKWIKILLVFSAIVICVNDIRFELIKYSHLESVLSHVFFVFVRAIIVLNILRIINRFTYNAKFKNSIYRGLLICSIILSISTFMSEQLYNWGFAIAEAQAKSDRPAGLFADGDCNSLAGFLCLINLFILQYNNLIKRKIKLFEWLVIFFNTATIFYTQSRMGFICIIFVFLVHILFSNDKRNIKPLFVYLLFGSVIVIFFTDLLIGVLDRMQGYSITSEVDGDAGRSIIWGMYLDYMLSSTTNIILFGAERMVFDIVPHNFYIYTFFVSGLIIAILIILIQLIATKKCAEILGRKNVYSLFILTAIPLMFLTSGTIIYYYAILLGMIGAARYSIS